MPSDRHPPEFASVSWPGSLTSNNVLLERFQTNQKRSFRSIKDICDKPYYGMGSSAAGNAELGIGNDDKRNICLRMIPHMPFPCVNGGLIVSCHFQVN